MNENATLQEEMASLKKEKEEIEIEIERKNTALNEEKENTRLLKEKFEKEKQNAEEEKKASNEVREKLEREKGEQVASLIAAQKRNSFYRIVITVICGLLASAICLFSLNYIIAPACGVSLFSAWGIALQLSIVAALFLLVAAFILKEYRKTLLWLFLVDGVAIAITLLSSMPSAKP